MMSITRRFFGLCAAAFGLPVKTRVAVETYPVFYYETTTPELARSMLLHDASWHGSWLWLDADGSVVFDNGAAAMLKSDFTQPYIMLREIYAKRRDACGYTRVFTFEERFAWSQQKFAEFRRLGIVIT